MEVEALAFNFAIRPAVPGLVIKEQVLHRMNLTQAELADAMGISRVRVNQLVNGHAAITVETALRLGHVTGSEPEYWLALQVRFDLFNARKRFSRILEALPVLTSDGAQQPDVARAPRMLKKIPTIHRHIAPGLVRR